MSPIQTPLTLDTDLLLSSGAIEGPYTRPHPVVAGIFARLTQWFWVVRAVSK